MARRTMNRRALRDMAEAAEGQGEAKASAAGTKASGGRKPRTTRAAAAKLGRMKVVWVVHDAGAHKVATFDFPQKTEADELAEKLTREKGNTHFVRQVKQPMAD